MAGEGCDKHDIGSSAEASSSELVLLDCWLNSWRPGPGEVSNGRIGYRVRYKTSNNVVKLVEKCDVAVCCGSNVGLSLVLYCHPRLQTRPHDTRVGVGCEIVQLDK